MSPQDLQIDVFWQRVWSSRFLWKGELLDCAGKRDPLCWYVIVWFGEPLSCFMSDGSDPKPSYHISQGWCPPWPYLDRYLLQVCGISRTWSFAPKLSSHLSTVSVRTRGSQQRHPIEPKHPLLPDGHEPRHGPRTFGTISWVTEPTSNFSRCWKFVPSQFIAMGGDLESAKLSFPDSCSMQAGVPPNPPKWIA